ncbi:glycerophosphodiester phosphodiesterase family protein [Actinophytocola sediminis]
MSELAWLTTRPIAHRGLYDEAAGRPENSLAAFAHAVSVDVPFEFDVQLTSDGQPVVLHDADVAAITGHAGGVHELDARAVRTLRLPGDQRVPTLEQVLELVDGRVPMVVDVRRWGLRHSPGLERAVADRLRGYRGTAVVQSFDPFALRRLRRMLPGLGVGQASGSLRSAPPVVRAIGRTMVTNAFTRPDFLTYELAELPNRFVSWWRADNRPVIAYTTYSGAEEATARRLADGFFFAGYLPAVYR